MKNALFSSLFLILIFMSGCNETADTPASDSGGGTAAAPESQPSSARKEKGTQYPIERRMEDAEGNKVHAVIHGKEGAEIAASAKGDEETYFILSIDSLGAKDQEYINKLTDGGRFAEVKEIIGNQN